MNDWTVSDGQIVVNHGWKVIDRPEVKVWEFDLHTKYAEVIAYANGDDSFEVLLGKTERTLHLGDGPEWTSVTFPYGGMSTVAEIGRYTLRVVAYRYPEQ